MIRRPPRSTRTDPAFPTRRSSDLPEIAGAGEDAFELRRRMADLRRIEADPGDATQPRQGRVERRLCLRLAEVAEETEDQPGGQAVAVAGDRKSTRLNSSH